MTRRLVSEETRQAVLDSYKAGQKLAVIESTLGVPRSTIYWILEQAGESPRTVQRGRRLSGDTQNLAVLYDMIEALTEENEQLKDRLRALGEHVDE